MTKVLKLAGLGLAVLLMAWGIASSQLRKQVAARAEGGADPTNRLFRWLDTDGDGALTESEIEKAGARLKELDATKDGKLTPDELAGLAGVQAALTSHVPIRHPAGDPPMWPAGRPADDPLAQYPVLARIVAPGYFRIVGIPLVAGRDLTAADRQGTAPVMVIDEHMAGEFFPGQNPIGQHVMAMGVDAGTAPTNFEVVGVVGSARLNSVAGTVEATAYMSSYQFGTGRINLMLRTPLTSAAATSTHRRLMAARHSDIPVEPVVPMETIVDDAASVLFRNPSPLDTETQSRLEGCCKQNGMAKGTAKRRYQGPSQRSMRISIDVADLLVHDGGHEVFVGAEDDVGSKETSRSEWT